MTNKEQRVAAKEFAAKWSGKGYEKGECQVFWMSLLRDVFGIVRPEEWLTFEHKVPTGFIDVWIPKTGVIVEQKGLAKGLADKEVLKQALQYAGGLPAAFTPRWVVLCNFQEFCIYDRNELDMKPVVIALKDLPKKVGTLSFLTEVNAAPVHISHEVTVSKAAGKVVGRLYNALLKKFTDRGIPVDDRARKSLNVFCVRTVFCAYAEDAGLFEKDQFVDYLRQFDAAALRDRMLQLFRMLNTPADKRDQFEREDLTAFPFVSSALFEDMEISVPQFDDEIRTIILDDMSANFDWSEISPTIFGAIFESTLNPEVRHDEGMHYTTPENIHRVIDPLFLDDLTAEFETIKSEATPKTRNRKLEAFQEKLGSLTFLDPACGSGNFLTETFVSLRRLENEAIKLRQQGQSELDLDGTSIHVKIKQFHGIELQDFAVTVAMSALWIAESQMMTETQEILHKTLEFLPLKSYSHIRKDNALRTDWESSLPEGRHFDYIISNPPFMGARNKNAEQAADVERVFAGWKNAGNLDYVTCWYKKAFDIMKGTPTRAAFVSTNSICQGDGVATLWKPLFADGLEIDFAWRTFVWDSEATDKAHVHVVIIGFNAFGETTKGTKNTKLLFDVERGKTVASHINGYLMDAPDAWIESRTKSFHPHGKTIGIGNKPIDGGNYLFDDEAKAAFLKLEPAAEKYFRRWWGSYETINRKPRWCLWLGECSPSEIKAMPECVKRVQAVRALRLASKSEGTRKLADRPTRFHVENMPEGNTLVIPKVSSEKRVYVPMTFLPAGDLCSDLVLLLPDADIFDFGVLTSSVHMAWMRAVAGRLEMRYRYSAAIVYNNFPWPGCGAAGVRALPEERVPEIEKTAQAILDARAKYPDSSLADLYDDTFMPPELRKAHAVNDAAVMKAYGFPPNLTEPEIVSRLFDLYAKLTSGDA